MMRARSRPCIRAFTLLELLFAAAVVLVALALLGLMAGRSRKMGQLGESMANLRRMGELTGSYAADYQERCATFTWGYGRIPPDADGDLRFASSDIEAAANQAIQIIRRRGQVGDIYSLGSWVPHAFYSSLVLADYAATQGPMSWAISPGDAGQLGRAYDMAGFRRGLYWPYVPNGDEWRWSFASSYEYGMAFCARDSGDDSLAPTTSFQMYSVPRHQGVLGTRQLSETRYPSQKALSWDRLSWYFGRRVAFYAMPEARVPALFVDGSVRVVVSNESNLGWDPRTPTVMAPRPIQYYPIGGDPELANGQSSVNLYMRQHATRWGMLGRDFDGPEVTTP